MVINTLLALSVISIIMPVEYGNTRSYFIAPDFYQLAYVEGRVYAASGFGLSSITADLRSPENIPTPGYSRYLALDEKNLYLGEGNRILDFKLSARSEPSLKGEYELADIITAMAVNQDYLAMGTEKEVIVYAREKKLTKLKAFPVDGAVVDLVFHDDHLYASCGRAGLEIIIVGKKDPVSAGNIPLNGAMSLEVGEKRLYVTTKSSELYVFSVKDPSTPVEESRTSSGSPVFSLRYFNKHLYAAQGYTGYAIFDTRGNRLEQKEAFHQGKVTDILPTEDGVFLATGENGVVKLEGKNPAELTVTGEFAPYHPSVHTSQTGSFWAVAQGKGGVYLALPEEESNRISKGFVDPRPKNALGVLLSPNYLYVADTEIGPSIFNLKNFPYAERELQLVQPGTPQRFALLEDLILLAAGEKGLRVLWICSCGPLKQRSALEEGVTALDVAVKDNIAYVADPDSGLRVVAVKLEGRRVAELSRYPGAISPRALHVDGDVLYVADSIGAVAAVDISDPANPAQLSFTFIPSSPVGLEVVGNTLYVACGEDGVLKMDVTDPAAPVVGEFIDTPGRALAVEASEKYLGVADYTSFILVPVEPSGP